MICLLNDVDMKILSESGLGKVKIEIQECDHEDFYDQTQQIIIESPVEKVEEEPVVEVVEASVNATQASQIKSEVSNEKSLEQSIT